MLWIGDGPRLWAMLHHPPEGRSSKRAVVFCAPFAEEEKCSRRPYVELARELARRGIWALRFSYRGTGDSVGEFSDLRLQGAMEDITAAVECCEKLTGASSVTLFGLRLGGTFALEAVRQGLRAERVALWAPIVNGKSYVRMNVRRKSIRRMINTADTASDMSSSDEGNSAAGNETGPAAGSMAAPDAIFDFDGYPVAQALWNDLEGLAATPPEGWEGGGLIVSVGSTDKPSGECVSLAGRLEAAGAAVKLETVVSQPFWNLLGLIECPAIIHVTADWMAA